MMVLYSTRLFFFWGCGRVGVDSLDGWGGNDEGPREEDSAGEKVRWMDVMDVMCKGIREEGAYQYLYRYKQCCFAL